MENLIRKLRKVSGNVPKGFLPFFPSTINTMKAIEDLRRMYQHCPKFQELLTEIVLEE